MWQVDPSRQLSLHPVAHSVSPDRWRIGRAHKRRKLVGQGKDGLISEGGRGRGKEKKNQVMQKQSSLTTRLMPNQTLSNSYFGKIPTFTVLLLNIMLYGMEYPFGWSRSAIPAAFPPHLLPTTSPLASGTEQKTEKALALHKHSSVRRKTLVCYQHRSGHWSKTQHHMGCYVQN